MWAIYWKRLPITQLFILGVCALLRFAFASPWPKVAALFVVMQFSALAGAWWGNRLRRDLEQTDHRRPSGRQ
jgi:hypothetical protein